jgi:hypothetical protein
MKKISNSLDKLDLKNNTTLALLFCEILGESRSTEFISTGKELSAYLTDNSSLRRLTYAFYLTGSEEGYESMIRMGKTPDLVNFITSLVESSDKMILGRVLESLKRSESDVQILDLIDIIESEVLFY